ncbi:hypothetical protein AAVH_14100 [Aphelenchoides avenae]|nr:hypothetical protein AAVH_14100 [Aphelenchus avenae]
MFGLFVDVYVDWDAGAKFLYESTNFCAWFQVCAHTVIALNRFSAFFFAQRHQRIWRGKNVLVIVALLLVSVIPGFVPCIAEPVHYSVLDDGRIALSYYKVSVHEATKIASASYYIPLSLLAFIVNIAGVVKYRQLVRVGVIRDFGQNQDIRLLGKHL